jgi:5-formyltetrahydrofolate cyclo-ligase
VARQDNIPRGRTIPMGAVPVEARGLRHMVPTYIRRRPGSPSNGRLGSALYAFGGSFRIGCPLTSTNADPKAALRRDALVRRERLEPSVRAAFSDRLADEGLRLARLWRPQFISAFHPLREEPDTLPLLTTLAHEGFATALPVVSGRRSSLLFRRWRPGDPTRAGSMSIREPLEEAPVVDPDLLFVPLACFDRRGHRIGYGAGYYDRTLARLRALKRVYAAGVAYAVSEVAAVPHETHDQRLDAVVTERETVLFTQQ